MKTRLGFVTNSSSSSFIISKKENLTSIDDVFILLKTLYAEYLEKRKALIEYCKTDKRFVVSEDGEKIKIEFANKKASYEERRVANDFLENQFGMCYYEVSHGNVDWLSCENYDEFVKQINESDRYFYINIVDLENPVFDEKSDIDSTASLIDWYMPCFVENYKRSCDGCTSKEYCYVAECDNDTLAKAKSASNREELVKVCFGRFCICSECGYIPDYVVNRLAEISSFCCNHMG